MNSASTPLNCQQNAWQSSSFSIWGEGPFGINGRSYPAPLKGGWNGAARVSPSKNKPSECLRQFSKAAQRFKRKNTEIQSFPSSLLPFSGPFPTRGASFPTSCLMCLRTMRGIWRAKARHTWGIKVFWMRSGQEGNSMWTLFTINMGICFQMEDLKCSNEGKSIRCYRLH